MLPFIIPLPDFVCNNNIDKFSHYFEQDMTASDAFHHDETQLMRDPVTLMLLANPRICPSLRDTNNMYEKWLVEKKELPNAPEMFDGLEQVVKECNIKYSSMTGKCFLQRFSEDVDDQQNLILQICNPLMTHVHTIIRQAGETAFIDYSGSLDRYYNPVFFVYRHYPSETLPLAVWITSNQSQTCLES